MRVLSRRFRTMLLVTGLLAASLLIGLDRAVMAPRWRHMAAGSAPSAARDNARYHGQTFTVTRVVDGDTLYLDVPDDGAPATKVRLLGIDAPELAHDGASAMYFARQATDYAREQLQGHTVTVYLDETPRTRGKYGRLLAYLEMPDGAFLNELLLAEGYAYADPRFAHSYLQRYRQLEGSARALGKGLWAGVTREQMPRWRQSRAP